MDTDLDRVAGALMGLAAGDALGAGYEFTTPGADTPIVMAGGGVIGWAPGEWTDDTAQAVGLAQVLATGSADLGAIGQRFLDWYAADPRDVGIQTRAVLGAVGGDPTYLPRAAIQHFALNPRGAAGNGSLMRTAPIALARLGEDEGILRLATSVSMLTHGDPLAAEACVIWCVAIDRAVREGRLDGVHDGVGLLPSDRRSFWTDRLVEAETRDPSTFTPNGFVVTALQAAYAAVHHTPVPVTDPARHLVATLEAAVRIGDDTDTVAAIAGQLVGARWGATAIPWRWRRLLHGWPGARAEDLTRLAVLTARHGHTDEVGWPAAPTLRDAVTGDVVRIGTLAADPGVLVGNLAGIEEALSQGVDDIISLCRVGACEIPTRHAGAGTAGVRHHRIRLIDRPGAGANPNLDLVLRDTVEALMTLRAEGRRVFLHCHGGRSRTAAVATGYLSTLSGRPATAHLRDVRAVLPEAHLEVFGDAVARVFPGREV